MCADDVAHLLHLLFHCTIIENHVIGAVPAVNLRVCCKHEHDKPKEDLRKQLKEAMKAVEKAKKPAGPRPAEMEYSSAVKQRTRQMVNIGHVLLQKSQ